MSASDPAGTPRGDIYGTISYVSNPFPQSSPERLFGLAQLFGLTPPRVESMRVLELGCASGGNIIPVAARYPGARVLGIDLAPRHVAEAKERIASAGLSNIEVRQGDIAALELGDERFDVIICHGVYSWVPPEAREAILRTAGRHLSEHGVAYVSYNVYPGWHLRSIIRDLMLFHAGEEGAAPPDQRIAKARWVIENVSKIAHSGSPYGAKLKEEAAALGKSTDAYVLGEFLAPHNAPCYFRDFAAVAEKHGLAFLCEADVETCLPETHGVEVASLIRTMSANQLVPMEQYIDFFMGRQFRQTLMARADQAGRIGRQLVPQRVRQLHVSGRLLRDTSHGEGPPYVFKDPEGRTVRCTSNVVLAALERLAAAWPATRSPADLKAEVVRSGLAIGEREDAEILDALFRMIIAGMGKVWSNPVQLGGAADDAPAAHALARADAAAGRLTTANLRHEMAALDVVMQVLLPHLDGRTSREELRRHLRAAVAEGRVVMTDNKTGQPVAPAALDRELAEHVELGLRRIAAAALLEA